MYFNSSFEIDIWLFLFWVCLVSYLPTFDCLLCRESCESEDTTSLPSSYPSSPTENGRLTTQTRSRPYSKSTLEENAYEDIVGKRLVHLLKLHFNLSLVSVRPAGSFLWSQKYFGPLVGWNSTFHYNIWGILDGPVSQFAAILWTD